MHVVLYWFRINTECNSMVANHKKCLFLWSSVHNSNITFLVENKHIKSSNEVKLLGINIDNKLTFTKHISNLCNVASNRLAALTKTRKFLSQEQARHLSEAYIMSTFKYCPLIWMFCGNTKNNLISKIHKCNLQLIYEMEDATFKDLLERDESKSIHE